MDNDTILAYMRSAAPDHVDKGGRLVATTLAEDACAHFNAYVEGEIPDEYWNCAFIVAEEHAEANPLTGFFAEKVYTWTPTDDGHETIVWA